ncbi:MAG TPA: phage holin family protein, partial [Gammaproteobacteria bacterium]|nr:phage holin family protein [Gammaproteobacteria bacterium]
MAYETPTPRPRSSGDGSATRDTFDEEAFDMTREMRSSSDVGNGRGRSAGDLLRQLLGDLTVLFRKELALAASEVSQSVDEAKHGATSLAMGGAVVYAGVLFLLVALTFLLTRFMDAWLAALIVGGVVTIIGIVMLQSGKKKMSATSLTPDRTVNSLQKDTQAIKR